MQNFNRQPYPPHPVLKEYARLASRYDRRWSAYIEASVRETLRRLTVKPGSRVLDIGCGTGALLSALSDSYRGISLVGADPSQEMLAVAQQRLGSHARLERAWGENLPFDSASFDVVVSCNAWHYIREPGVALSEALRVLKPNGLFVVTDWCHDYLACRVLHIYLRLLRRAHYRTYGKKECYDMLCDSGFSDVKIERYKISRLWGLMTATGYKEVV